MRLIKSAYVVSIAAVGYFIWVSDLPALSILDDKTLWEITDSRQIERTVPDSEEVTVITEQVVVPITLRDLAVSMFIVIVTFIAVQNLPGLMEILLLQRLSLIAGERYAIKSIIGYVLTVAGGIWAFTLLGLSWTKIQWLVAAVGLGLGFGLQEIFANLVSGLIILFERPIRVGDTVTVGDISGTVSRIRIRATWITAFNRQELIVPNKEFVTGRLVNWTLSDQILRVDIPVGIAYGSDTELARRLMLEVARAHPEVLADPEPIVYFQGFGDSSLNFELRVHSPNIDNFMPIKDAMHTGIDRAFREHGLEIPFPQRDLHVRSIEAPLPKGDGGDSSS
jgi:potassium efflux system protein